MPSLFMFKCAYGWNMPLIIAAMRPLRWLKWSFGPQYTIPPIVVGAIEPRVILIPEFARRVSLLVKYGSAPGGDAPLAALFLGFALPLQGSQGFIDALSARGSLFGEGLPIPHGAYALVLTNLSGVADLEMGVIFHLGL